MEFLQPQTFWINGICYRRLDVSEADNSQDYRGGGDVVDEYDSNMEDINDTTEDDDFNFNDQIERLSADRYRLSLNVATAFFAIIIGKKGSSKKRIETETRTRINIPKQSQQREDSGEITINGDSRSAVNYAGNRIMHIVQSARSRQEFTHFISFPISSSEVKKAFLEFKKEILQGDCRLERGIEESVFQDENLLHLTVGTMALMDSRERHRASEILQDCKEEIILPLFGENTIPVHLKGLEIMNDDPSEVDVLYVKVASQDGSDKLQVLADKLVDKFVAEGLMDKQYEKVKIHLTVMNTLFRKSDQNEENPKRTTLNAKRILELFGDYDFGQSNINEVHLSQRRTAGARKDGYYKASAVVSLQSCG